MFRLLLIAACLAVSANAYSEGAPKDSCGNLTPGHGAQLQTAPPPYTLTSSPHVKGGEKLTLKLSALDDATFLGFIIQARDGQNRVLGKFEVLDAGNSQTLDCSGAKDTLTHVKAKSPKTAVSFAWTAPADYKGNVKFMATVVQTSFVYWVGRVTKDVVVE